MAAANLLRLAGLTRNTVMANTDQLRAQAHRLLALAMKARDRGDNDHADFLTGRAAELLDRLDPSMTQPPTDPSQQRPVQQQQQIQPKDDKEK